MTLRKNWSPTYPDEQIDALIRRALRDRVMDATPPADGWWRVQMRAEERAAFRRPLRTVLGLPLKVARACQARVDRFLLAYEVSTMHLAAHGFARCDLHRVWMNQHRIALRLVC